MDLARSSLKLLIANIGSAVIGFLGIVYFARQIGPAALGVFFLFQAIVGMLAIPADFGLRGALEKRISEGSPGGEVLSSAVVLKIIPVTAILFVIFQSQSTLNGYLGAPVAHLLAAAIVLQEAARLSFAILKGELRVGETAVLNLCQQVIWVGIGAFLISYGFEAKALIYSFLAGISITLVWGWHKTSISFGTPSISRMQSLFDYGKFNVVSSIGGYFYSWMDVAILGIFLTQAHVGAYETAWRVTAITLLFSQSIASTIFPQISQWDAADATSQIESVIHETITPSMLLVIPAFFGMFVFSHEILGLVFGPEFTIAATVLVVLSAEKVLHSVHLILGRALQGIDRPDLAARATIISVLVNLALNVVLILSLGLIGAAIATALSFAVNTALHVHYLSNSITIEFPYSEVGWCTLSAGGMGAILFGVRTLVAINTVPRLLLAIALGVGLYGTFVLLYRPIRIMVFRNIQSLLAE